MTYLTKVGRASIVERLFLRGGWAWPGVLLNPAATTVHEQGARQMSINLQLIIEGLILVLAVLEFVGVGHFVRTRRFAPMSRRELVGGILALVGILFLIYTAGRVSALSRSPLPAPSLSPTPAFPATNIEFSAHWGPGLPGFRGKVAAINVQVLNSGPQLARNVCYGAKLAFLPTPVLEGAEDQLFTEFLKDVQATTGCEDIGPGQLEWATLSKKLTNSFATDLRNGRFVMFVFGHVKFVDANGSHDVEVCEGLQPPGDALIWHLCPNHNHVL